MAVAINQVRMLDDDEMLWAAVRREASEQARDEPILASFLHATVLNHASLGASLSFHLANKLNSPTVPAMVVREIIDQVYAEDPEVLAAVRADMRAVRERDPACTRFTTPLLFFKGFHALQVHRVAHRLWTQGRTALAMFLNSRVSEVCGVDIHPAARLGRGIMLDHATGIVIGETAVVDDNVSILQEVTLGGTGKESGDRHPKVRAGVMIGAGAKILGNVVIGTGAKIGAGSVVLEDVPPHCTVVGVPARVVGECGCESPALEMDQRV